MAKLTFVLEDNQEIVVPIVDRVTVGRAEGNDVVVDDERISSHHAEVLVTAGGRVDVIDLKSTAGTFVNGARVHVHALEQGDKIDFGPLVAYIDLEELQRGADGPREPTARVALPEVRPKPATKAVVEPKSAAPKTAEPVPGSVKSDAERGAENRVALLEAAAKQAEATHQEWLAAIDVLAKQHQEKEAALKKATEALAKAQDDLTKIEADKAAQAKELAAVQEALRQEQARAETIKQEAEKQAAESAAAREHFQREQAAERAKWQAEQEAARTAWQQEQATVRAEWQNEQQAARAQMQAEQDAARAELQRHQDAVKAAQDELAAAKAAIAGFADSEAKIAATRAMTEEANAALAAAEAQRTKLEGTVAALRDELKHQEAALTAVETRLVEAEAQLGVCREQFTAEKRQLDEVRARYAEIQAANQAPLEEARRRIQTTQDQLAALQARLMPLRDWKEEQDRRTELLAGLPASSPEARDLRREIADATTDLLTLMNLPASRTPRIVQVEIPFFKGVPMKSGSMRIQAEE